MAGERVYLPTRDPIIVSNLKNNLNVIKSRSKKVFKELGFAFKDSIIKIDDHIQETFGYDTDKPEIKILIGKANWSMVYLVAPNPRTKYSTFTIGNNEQPGSKEGIKT